MVPIPQRRRPVRHAANRQGFDTAMLRLLIALPIMLIFALFALSNPAPVRLVLWPTDLSIEVPISLAVLVAAAVAFLLGALVLWTSLLGARLRARRAEHAVRLLETQVTTLKAERNVLRENSLRESNSRALAPVGR
jgi:uncharacterized integral membrane protein